MKKISGQEREDKLLDDYLNGYSKISQLYRHTKADCSPTWVSDKILSSASQASKSIRKSLDPAWYIPTSLVAGIALAIGVILKTSTSEEPPTIHVAVESETSITETAAKHSDKESPLDSGATRSRDDAITDRTQEPDHHHTGSIRQQQETKIKIVANRFREVDATEPSLDTTIVSNIASSVMEHQSAPNLANPSNHSVAKSAVDEQPDVSANEHNDLLQTVSDNIPLASRHTPANSVSADKLDLHTNANSTESHSATEINELLQTLGDTRANNAEGAQNNDTLLQPLGTINNAAPTMEGHADLTLEQWLKNILRLYKENRLKEAQHTSKSFTKVYPKYPLQEYLKKSLDPKIYQNIPE